MTAIFRGSALIVLCTAGIAAAAPPDGPNTYDFRGLLGAYRIGCELVVENDRTLQGGHYFYASQLTDIPVAGTIDGETVTLREPGGGTFRLHFVGNGSAAGQPLTFYTSVGLAGDWTRDGTTLPVKLDLDGGMNGPQPARRYKDATDEPDAAFEARVRAFIEGAVSGDRQAVAALVSYPLRVNGRPAVVIRSKEQLLARWREVFTPKLTAAMKEAVPHDMFVRNGQVMLGRGVVWFDGKGALAINEP